MTKFKFKSVMIFIAILTITCLTYSIKNADADALPVITDGVLGIELPDVKYIGGVVDGLIYEGKTISDNLTLADFPIQSYQDTAENINTITNEYNISVVQNSEVGYDIDDDLREGRIVYDMDHWDFDYLSLKWGEEVGGWYIWDISEMGRSGWNQISFGFSGLSHGLSHRKTWDITNTTPNSPVPVPPTMLLLGSGLIGMITVGRRKLFK